MHSILKQIGNLGMSEVSKYFEKRLLNFESGEGLFFTSDSHFHHTKIIEFCNRPFSSVEEMDEKLIEKWNSVIKPEDTVFHLGDFAWGGSQVWNDVLNKLNGHIHLILGNHDMKNLRQGYMEKFESVSFQKQIYVENRCIYLNHYPFLCYGGVYRTGDQAVWQLFGHVHSQPQHYGLENIDDEEVREILTKDLARLQYLYPTQYDVGVDNNDYTPVSFDQIKTKIIDQMEKSKENEVF